MTAAPAADRGRVVPRRRGHNTRSTVDRYHIVSEDNLERATHLVGASDSALGKETRRGSAKRVLSKPSRDSVPIPRCWLSDIPELVFRAASALVRLFRSESTKEEVIGFRSLCRMYLTVSSRKNDARTVGVAQGRADFQILPSEFDGRR